MSVTKPARHAKTKPAPSQKSQNPGSGSKALEAFEAGIGYGFQNRDLFLEALTHASADTGSHGRKHALRVNERLEFLGDRVLGLLAAEALIAAYPDDPEGDLAPRLNALVRKETCAEVAQECGLDAVLILAASEEQSGGRRKPAILGDACEALMAALYIDGGMDAASGFFKRFWGERVTTLDAVPRDAKTRLQEWAQGKWQVTPRYTTLSRTGPDHEPIFEIEVQVAGLDPASGSGPSKRQAEQAAAQALLDREQAVKGAPRS